MRRNKSKLFTYHLSLFTYSEIVFIPDVTQDSLYSGRFCRHKTISEIIFLYLLHHLKKGASKVSIAMITIAPKISNNTP